MKKVWADKWVEALRSGKYPQATGGLRNSDGFCCLGVLCDISNLGEWIKDIAAHPSNSYKINKVTAGGMLPPSLMMEVGMNSTEGRVVRCVNDIEETDFVEVEDDVGSKHQYEHLASWNDEDGTFEQIANWIEKNYEKL